MSGLGRSAEKSASVWLEGAALGDESTGVRALARHRFADAPGAKLTLVHLAIDIKLLLLLRCFVSVLLCAAISPAMR
jgi:hypothetical protein